MGNRGAAGLVTYLVKASSSAQRGACRTSSIVASLTITLAIFLGILPSSANLGLAKPMPLVRHASLLLYRSLNIGKSDGGAGHGFDFTRGGTADLSKMVQFQGLIWFFGNELRVADGMGRLKHISPPLRAVWGYYRTIKNS